MPDSTVKRLARIGIALFFVTVGVAHFVSPAPFLHIMPPYLPWHIELVYVSGFFEVLGGIGLCVPVFRRAAGWGLVALLVAVYPANVHMLVNEVYLPDMPKSKALLWARMPLQFVMGALVVWTAGIWPRRRPRS